MKNPLIDDKFYEDKSFLTAKRAVSTSDRFVGTAEYVKEHNIKTCVMPYYGDLENWLKKNGDYDIIASLCSGEDYHPLYASNGLLFVVPFVGGPNAAGLMEEIAALGIKNFIACGSAGLIDHTFNSKKMLVVDCAVRDEGASYHYSPVEILAETDKKMTKCIEKVFENHNIQYEVGKTWTTDGFYRETEKLIKQRLTEGCTAVEMECATWCIVAKKLGLKFAQFLYFSDAVDGVENWEMFPKEYRKNLKMLMTEIAFESAKLFDETR